MLPSLPTPTPAFPTLSSAAPNLLRNVSLLYASLEVARVVRGMWQPQLIMIIMMMIIAAYFFGAGAEVALGKTCVANWK